MASEAVEIIISADDQASQKMAQVAANSEKMAASVKSTAKTTKASTEFAGTIASLFGGSEIGQFASQIGGLTEKVGQFSDVAKGGGASALLLKAGLVAAAGAIAFQIGKAIGDIIWQTEEMNRKFEETRTKMRELGNETNNLLGQQFSDDVAFIKLLDDPEKEKEELKSLLDSVVTNMTGAEAKVRSSKKAVDEWAAAWKITGERLGSEKIAQDQLASDEQRLKQLKEQRAELERMLSPANDEIEARKAMVEQQRKEAAEVERVGKLRDDELAKLEQAKVAFEQGAEAAHRFELVKKGMDEETAAKIARETAALKEQETARQQLAKDEEDARSKATQKQKMQDDELARLEEMRIAFEHGAEAAHRFRLVRSGMDSDVAAKIAAETAALKDQEKAREESIRNEEKLRAEAEKERIKVVEDEKRRQAELLKPTLLSATESRLLSRGSGSTTEKTLQESKALLERIAAATERPNRGIIGVKVA